MSSLNSLTVQISALPTELIEAIIDFLPLSSVLELSTKSLHFSSIILSSPTWRGLFISLDRLETFQKLYYLILDIHPLLHATPFTHGEWSNSSELTLTYRWYAVRNWTRRVDPVVDLFTQMEACIADAFTRLEVSRVKKIMGERPKRRKGKGHKKYRLKWSHWVRASTDGIQSGVDIDRFREYIALLKTAQETENLEESKNLQKLAGLLERCVQEIERMQPPSTNEIPRKDLRPLIAHLLRQSKECLHRPVLRPDGPFGSLAHALPYDQRLVLIIQVLCVHAPLSVSEPDRRLWVPNEFYFTRNIARLHLDNEGYASARTRKDGEYAPHVTCDLHKILSDLGIALPLPDLPSKDKSSIKSQRWQWDLDELEKEDQEDEDTHVETAEEKEAHEAAEWLAAFLRVSEYFELEYPNVKKSVETRHSSVGGEGGCK